LGHAPDGAYSDSNNGNSRNGSLGILYGTGKISKERCSTDGLSGVFKTLGSIYKKCLSIRFTIQTSRAAIRVCYEYEIMVTISKNDKDFGGFSTNSRGTGGGQHVGSVYYTSRNTSSGSTTRSEWDSSAGCDTL
jgi:hypothetical protein